MTDTTNFNQTIIDEFRANGGKVGGGFDGMPMVIIHTKGAKSGQPRENPLAALVDDDGTLYIFASKGGAPTNPDWYYNIVANPEIEVEFGTDTFTADATVLTGDKRTEIYEPPEDAHSRLRRLRGRHDPGHPRGRPDPQGLNRWRLAASAGEKVPTQPHETHHEDDPSDRMGGDFADHGGRVRHRRGSHVRQPPEHDRQRPDHAPHDVGDRADTHRRAPCRTMDHPAASQPEEQQ